MQQLYWGEGIRLSYSDQCDVMERLKVTLNKVRDRVKSGLTEIELLTEQLNCDPENIRSERYNQLTDLWISKVKSLSSSCNKDMIDFTSTVIEKAVKICGPPPCDFASVGIGSIARGETTPYSDLELLFLVEDKAHEQYFERLAVTTYFLIGNLGETKLKYMNIQELAADKWFEDESKNGFKIDGLSINAGNIPTGNGSEKKRNKFIATIDELVAEYEEVYRYVPDCEKALKGDLSAMLASTVLLYGSERMGNDFTQRTAAIDTTEARRSITREMLKNEEIFLLKPGRKLAHKMELKGQIYRYLTIMVFDMKIYFKLSSSQCWTVINEMIKKDVISAKVGKDLKVLVATALFIRLSAYTHYDSQDNSITIWTADRKAPEKEVKREIWTISKTLLQLFFAHLLPVEKAVKTMVLDDGDVDEYDDTRWGAFYTAGLISFYCENYQSFLGLTAKAPESCRKTENWKLMELKALRKSNRFDIASKMAHEMISDGGLSSWCEGDVYNELGLIHYTQGDYAEALEYSSKSLAIGLTEHRNSNHSSIASSYITMGSVYYSQGEYATALECYSKCLAIQLTIYRDSNHPDIASSYNNIGIVYDSQGEYAKALECYNRCLATQLAAYGHSNHPEIASSYNNIGLVYNSQGQYTTALECYNKGLAIQFSVYGDSNHLDVARSYHNIGSVYRAQGEYAKALQCYKGLAIQLSVYRNSNHPGIASSHHNMGSVYHSQGKYARALECYNRCLAIQLTIYEDSNRLDIATSYYNIATVYKVQREYAKALEFFSKYLAIRQACEEK